MTHGPPFQFTLLGRTLLSQPTVKNFFPKTINPNSMSEIITLPQPIEREKEIVQFSSLKRNQLLVVFKKIKDKGIFCSLPGLKNEDSSSPRLVLKRKFLHHSLVKVGNLVGNFQHEKTSSTVYSLKEPIDVELIKKQKGVLDAKYVDLSLLLKGEVEHPLTHIAKEAIIVIHRNHYA